MRCVSNSRACEGYGIWGERSTNTSSNDPDSAKSLPVILAEGVSVHMKPTTYVLPRMKMNGEEVGWVEWFQSRTIAKMQGPFVFPFWNNLVVRVSLHEPSVFHAMLALSSLHKKVSIGNLVPGPERDIDQLDLFSLRNYTKAINELLQPQTSDRNKAVVRSTLVACILFIHIECLCGRLKTANRHLQSGMKLLPHLVEYAGSNREPADTWLIGIFNRINLAALQLGQGYLADTPPIAKVKRPLPWTFETLVQGRDIMDTILNELVYLTAHPGGDPVGEQERIKADLAAWKSAYKMCQTTLYGTLGPLPMLAFGVLLFHYPMVKIMAETYLRAPGDEMVFDAYTSDFVSMVTHATHFIKLVSAVHRSGDPVFRRISDGRVHFTSDIGWCPHLYYTALHCRVSSVRWRAIELLRVMHTREGIWDACLVASAAQEVMLMEEETPLIPGFIREYPNMFDPAATHQLKELADTVLVNPIEPLPPAWRRVYDVRVILPDRLVLPCKATLVCRRHNFAASCGYEEITREFDVIGTAG